MKADKQITEVIIANALVAILERLNDLEKATLALSRQMATATVPAPNNTLPSAQQAVLLQRLEGLTLKRHAALTATLGGLSYQTIANLMGCDLTTVKLHLKSALGVLEVRNRAMLLSTKANTLDFIDDGEYQRRYGLSKKWWLEQKPELMAVLQAKKPAHNQHTSV